MNLDIRSIRNITDLIGYFSQNLGWDVDIDDFDDIDDISYDFSAEDIGLKEEAFAKISSLKQLQPLVDNQQWGIFCIEFNSVKFEVSALRKILSGLVPRRRNSIDHAVWEQQDLLFICNWGEDNNKTIGVAHFEDKKHGLPQIKMISCAPALEDFTQIHNFEASLAKLRWPKNTSNIDEWRKVWSSAFTSGYHQVIRDATTLTIQLAAEAQNIRNHIMDIMAVESSRGYVHTLFEKFRNSLIHDLNELQFADMYAQTVVYGLFSARCMAPHNAFSSFADAIKEIPNTNPFLKGILTGCLGIDNQKLAFDELEVENVIDVLRHAQTDLIIKDFNRQTGGGKEDPVIHFYEDFLTAYDKQQKVQRGVFYTPQPVVNFIVSAVNSILVREFDFCDGLASSDKRKIKIKRQSKNLRNGLFYNVDELVEIPAVQILDPATGTGTFIRQVIIQIYENIKKKYKHFSTSEFHDYWNEYVKDSLLPRLNAFELMMAPYAVAHMKIAMILKDTGYDFIENERVRIFLTNSLEEPGSSDDQILLFDDPLAKESIAANRIKKNNGINIVIGNPPYSGESANKGKWISDLIETYKTEPGGIEKLKERNGKWINDDYVKFIRLAQLFVEKSGRGIVSYICPHGFIDNPTFRGMRWNLASCFDDIYLFDLHGNTKKREVCPDGSKDENVFDIQQGVCIITLVKKTDRRKTLANVYYADILGSREHKYSYLNDMNFFDVPWTKVNIIEPFYLFKPTKQIEIKSPTFKVTDLFPISVMGFQTHRDYFAISLHEDEMRERINDLRSDLLSDEVIKSKYNLIENDSWTIKKTRYKLHNITDVEFNKKLIQCQYRIFDTRWCYLDESIMDRPRSKVFNNIGLDNYILGVGRQGLAVGDIEWQLAIATKYPIDANIFRRGGVTACPLYIYDDFIDGHRTLNLNLDLIQKFESILGLRFKDESTSSTDSFNALDVFDYVYAVLYSHKYHDVFADDLKIDYPAVPFPDEVEYFREMVRLGTSLRMCHVEGYKIECYDSIHFTGKDYSVDGIKFKNNRIYINKTSFFEGDDLSDDLWNYTIGGYQVIQKWLKDRKGMELGEEDISNCCVIIRSIFKTLRIMEEIDSLIRL